MIKRCECGCGEIIANVYRKYLPSRRFISGHNLVFTGVSTRFKKGQSPSNGFKREHVAWNKGLTSEIDERVQKCGKKESLTKQRKNLWFFDLCQCGCGNIVKRNSKYIKGHGPSCFKKGHSPWTTGKTKQTDERIKIGSEKRSKTMVNKILNGQYTPPIRYINGRFHSKKMNKEYWYRSNLELTALKKAETDPTIRAFVYEPFRIPYIWMGKFHSYTPDLLNLYVDGTIEIVEIKPRSMMMAFNRNQIKFITLKQYCKEKGYKCSFWDEYILK